MALASEEGGMSVCVSLELICCFLRGVRVLLICTGLCLVLGIRVDAKTDVMVRDREVRVFEYAKSIS